MLQIKIYELYIQRGVVGGAKTPLKQRVSTPSTYLTYSDALWTKKKVYGI